MSSAAKKNPGLEKVPNAENIYTRVTPKTNWKVLIVEDEPAIADAIQNIIAPKENLIPIKRSSRQEAKSEVRNERIDQFEVTWAKSPLEALRYVQSAHEIGKPFAMGFFDVMLGSDIDGIELVRQIHLIDPKMYAVFVTAYHDRTVDSINQILGNEKSDRWDYMNKPFTDGEILQKARNSVSLWNLKNQKELQDDQLAEAAKLLLEGERTNTVAAVGRSVAHEFGNMLMHIMGHAELALLKKGDEARSRQALETILKAAETASAVLSKFKKLNSNDTAVELKLINLNRCLDEAVDLMAHEFKKRSIKVVRIKNEQCLLEANHHSLIQVFMNLFINATHAMPNSGQLDLFVGKTAKDYVEVRIRDYGPGIPQELLPKVTEVLFTTKGNQGTGLGLAISKEIIEIEHGGEFSITNHTAKGVEVIIRIPTRQEVNDVPEKN